MTTPEREWEERLVTKVLCNPPLDPMPPGLSAQIVRYVRIQERRRDRLELWLQYALMALMLAMLIWIALRWGEQGAWFSTSLYGQSAICSLVILTCFGMYKSFEHWQWKAVLARWNAQAMR